MFKFIAETKTFSSRSNAKRAIAAFTEANPDFAAVGLSAWPDADGRFEIFAEDYSAEQEAALSKAGFRLVVKAPVADVTVASPAEILRETGVDILADEQPTVALDNGFEMKRAAKPSKPFAKSRALGQRALRSIKAAQADNAKAKPATAAAKAPTGKRAEVVGAAVRGVLPTPPDFSGSDIHKANRPRLAALVAMAEAGDVAGLEAFPIKPNCTSPKAMDRYRNLAVTALKARAS